MKNKDEIKKDLLKSFGIYICGRDNVPLSESQKHFTLVSSVEFASFASGYVCALHGEDYDLAVLAQVAMETAKEFETLTNIST